MTEEGEAEEEESGRVGPVDDEPAQNEGRKSQPRRVKLLFRAKAGMRDCEGLFSPPQKK